MPFVYLFTTILLWSFIPLATKLAGHTFSAGCVAFTRVFLGVTIFGLYHWTQLRGTKALPEASPLLGPRWLSPTAWTVLAGISVCGDQFLYAFGLQYTSASAAALIVSSDGVLLTLLGVLILKERMSWMKAGAGISALTGLLLVNWSGLDLRTLLRSEYLLGNLAVLGAAFCWAGYGMGQRVLSQQPGGGLFNIFLIGAAAIGMIAVTQPPVHHAVTWTGTLALLGLGLLGTGMAYILLVKAMRSLEAATVGLISCTLPLFTMVEAHFLMGEKITSYLAGGAICVIAAVILVVWHQRVYGQS